MPKFMIAGRYTPQGMQGVKKDKASGRQKAITAACHDLGGKVEAIYFALGEDDVYVIADMPSVAAVSSLCVTVGSSGMVKTRTVPLLTIAEMDAALDSNVKYRPPGG